MEAFGSEQLTIYYLHYAHVITIVNVFQNFDNKQTCSQQIYYCTNKTERLDY